MPTRYVWDREANSFVDPSTRAPMPIPDRDGICLPAIRSDIAAYRSVTTNKVIEGRAAQREDLKRSGCRLVDPSEAPAPVCRTKKWARILRMDHEPPPPAPERVTSVGPIKVE